jgi:hypothetical protein
VFLIAIAEVGVTAVTANVLVTGLRCVFVLVIGCFSEYMQLNLLNTCKGQESNVYCKHWNYKMA